MRHYLSRLFLTLVLAIGLGAAVGGAAIGATGPAAFQVADPGGSAGGNGG